MANEFVTFNPYDEQLEKLRQRQKMADLLQQQALQPLESQVAPGGYAVRTSPVLGLAKMLQAYMGGREQNKIDTELSNIRNQAMQEQRGQEAETASAAAGITGRMFGEKPPQYDKNGLLVTPRETQPAVTEPSQPSDQLGEITPTAKYQYDPSGAMQMAMTPAGARAMQGNPAMAAMLAQMVKPKEPEKFGTTPVQGADGNFYLVSESGRMVKTPVAGQVKTPEEPSSVREYQYAKNQGFKGTFEQYQLNKLKAGATNVNVPVTTSRSYGQEVASSLAKADSDAIAAARAAPEQIASSQRIRNLLAQNPITGTGADARLALDKALSTAGLIDPNRSITTENLVSELANGTLGAVKTSGLGTGQGFTDKDLEFLQKARSGNIEINSATLARIADLNERAARAAGAKGNAVINRLSKSGNFGPELGLEPVELPPISGALPPGFTPDRRR